jgi:thymidine phosphorylase
LDKFEKIRKLQGRREIPPLGSYGLDVFAQKRGHVRTIDNIMISRTAQLAGAPQNAGAGVYLAKHVNDFLEQNELLLRIYAESDEALTFAKRYWAENANAAIVISEASNRQSVT